MRRACVLALLALAAAAPDPVIAVRGRDQITASQLRTLLAAADQQTREKLEHDPKALQDFLRNALLERAILAEAQSAGFDRKPDVVAMLTRVRDSALAQTYLANRAAVPPAYPSEAELREFYDKAKPQLMQPRAYHLLQAFVTLPADEAETKGEDKAKAQLGSLRDALAKASAARPPGTLAPGVSLVDLGWVTEDRLQPAAKDAVSGLLEGQVSPPVCAKGGCSILRLLATRPAGPAPLPDVRLGLIRLMRQAKEKQGETAYANALLTKSPVRVDEIELAKITGR